MNAREKRIVYLAQNILEKNLKTQGITLDSSLNVIAYLKLNMSLSDREIFTVLFLNNRNQLIESHQMFLGTYNCVEIHPREIIKKALELNTSNIIIAHNHPSGNVYPSQADKVITQSIDNVLKLLDIELLDHIIVGNSEDTYSFADNGLL